MKETRSKVTKNAVIGDKINQGFVRFARPCPSNSPHDEVGAGKPKPRKSKDTNELILATIANGAKDITGVKAFGNICLNIIVESVHPIALAAYLSYTNS